MQSNIHLCLLLYISEVVRELFYTRHQLGLIKKTKIIMVTIQIYILMFMPYPYAKTICSVCDRV